MNNRSCTLSLLMEEMKNCDIDWKTLYLNVYGEG